LHKLLDHHELDNDTKEAIAERGNSEHLHKLLDEHKLDHDTKNTIASHKNADLSVLQKLLDHHELDDATKYAIASHKNANSEVLNTLLDDPNLPSRIKYSISIRENPEHLHKLLDHHELDDRIIHSIAVRGKPEHLHKLLDHDINDDAKNAISKVGNVEVLHKLLDHHELDHDTKESIAKNKGGLKKYSDAIDRLLDKHELNDATKNIIYKQGNDGHREKLKKLGFKINEEIKFKKLKFKDLIENDNPDDREIGTISLRNKYIKDTPNMKIILWDRHKRLQRLRKIIDEGEKWTADRKSRVEFRPNSKNRRLRRNMQMGRISILAKRNRTKSKDNIKKIDNEFTSSNIRKYLDLFRGK